MLDTNSGRALQSLDPLPIAQPTMPVGDKVAFAVIYLKIDAWTNSWTSRVVIPSPTSAKPSWRKTYRANAATTARTGEIKTMSFIASLLGPILHRAHDGAVPDAVRYDGGFHDVRLCDA